MRVQAPWHRENQAADPCVSEQDNTFATLLLYTFLARNLPTGSVYTYRQLDHTLKDSSVKGRCVGLIHAGKSN